MASSSPSSRYSRLSSPPPGQQDETFIPPASFESPVLSLAPDLAQASRRAKKKFPRFHFRKFRRRSIALPSASLARTDRTTLLARLRRWFVPLFLCFLLLSLGGVIFGSFTSYMSASFAFRNRTDITYTGDVITLEGKVTNIDLVNAKISITWTLFACGGPELTGEEDAESCSTPIIPVDIYSNENQTLANQPHEFNNATGRDFISGWDPKMRIFGYDPEADSFYSVGDGEYQWGYWQAFSQELPFSIQDLQASRRANDLAYPFDKYHIIAAFTAVAPRTNLTYPLDPSFGGVLSNWAISMENFASNATKFGMDPNSRQLKITVGRSGAAVAFASCIFIVNWVITFVIMWQTALLLIWRMEMVESLVVIPLTALFSMPAIRSVAPGNPAFGSFYDVCGFLLQISIVGLCSAIVLFTTLVGKEHVFDPKEEGSRSLALRELERTAESIRSSRRESSGSTYRDSNYTLDELIRRDAKKVDEGGPEDISEEGEKLVGRIGRADDEDAKGRQNERK